ncbi:MAG: hypothetical protein Tsb0013_21050 [Phycisphaerales bacterium]
MRHLPFLLVTVLLLCVPSARGQTLRAEALTEQERDAVILTLRLSADEIETLDAFARACTAERQRIADQQQERIRRIWKEQTDAARRGEIPDMEAAMASINDARRLLEDAQTRMIRDLALTFDDDRTELVERCVLRLYRLRTLDAFGGQISGLTADPLAVAHSVGVPELLDTEHAERFERAMLSYDRAIAKRLREYVDLQDDAARTFSRHGFDEDADEVNKVFEEIVEFIHDIKRTHNDRAAAIANTLPTDLRSVWHDHWHRASFPTVYRPHYAETTIDRLIGHPAITPEEREALRSLRADLADDLERARLEACEAIEEAESDLTPEQARGDTTITSDDVRRTRAALDDLAGTAHDAILRVLPPERHALVPPPDGASAPETTTSP